MDPIMFKNRSHNLAPEALPNTQTPAAIPEFPITDSHVLTVLTSAAMSGWGLP